MKKLSLLSHGGSRRERCEEIVIAFAWWLKPMRTGSDRKRSEHRAKWTRRRAKLTRRRAESADIGRSSGKVDPPKGEVDPLKGGIRERRCSEATEAQHGNLVFRCADNGVPGLSVLGFF